MANGGELMPSYISADVECPFYVRDNLKTVCLFCEGVLPGSSLRSKFPDKPALLAHMRKYCCEDYRSCPWCRLLMQNYRE